MLSLGVVSILFKVQISHKTFILCHNTFKSHSENKRLHNLKASRMPLHHLINSELRLYAKVLLRTALSNTRLETAALVSQSALG